MDENHLETEIIKKIRGLDWRQNPHDKELYNAENVPDNVREFLEKRMEKGKIDAHTITGGHVPLSKKDLEDFGVDLGGERKRGE